MWQISASVGSYESGAVNKQPDVRTVQQMLTEAAKKLNNPRFHPGGIDGLIARSGASSATVTAITNFQLLRVGMVRADQRIDVGGKTWKTLVAAIGNIATPIPTPAAGNVTLTVRHGGKVPTHTTRQGNAAPTFSGMYESVFLLSGGLSGTFRGSIWPDDMTVKGRVVDGTYPLHIGFHKGGGAARQGANNLVVKTQGIRPGLLVNCRNAVSVESDNPTKKTSYGINVHNGFRNQRFSDGCLTIEPSDWPKFIQKFLDGFPNINDWHTNGVNSGKKIGQLVIQP
ncbi:hypothetical protein DTL21_09655 [Bremerella cremea]|uniref:Uncharacterized protein n=1 Tax=Blastopirellula marina TaxID=124 RepID=A0A2S8FVU3_9BACT|nr:MULTISPECIES: hypothetical protein [Pirellulaceae]PQO36170.1 hypothetical protein C5Y83_09650 [Blastopirellula marina]RCS48847.1 hypothetical protein DTL21_09655 [Bremerella cremea]